MTALVTAFVGLTAQARDRAEFRRAVEQARETVAWRLDTYTALLRAGAGLFAVDPSIDRERFQRYVDALDLHDRYPGIQGFGFARRIAPDAASAAGVTIWPPSSGEAFPVVFLEPRDPRNEAALGFDMSSEPIRRAAMERARDTGRPATSGRVTLVQEIDEAKQAGFLIYMPVYRGGVDPGTVEARREALLGFVYSPFRADDLFAGIFAEESSPVVDLSVFDGPASQAALLHRSATHRTPVPPGYTPRFAESAALDIAGRPWTLQFATRPEFDRGSLRDLASFVLLGGVLVSLAVFSAVRAQTRARAEAERLYAAEGEARRNAEIANRAKDEFLATLSHELRTPLTAIMGWVRMLRGGHLDAARSTRALEVIERNATLQTQLVEDLLDVSRVVTGKLRLDVRPIVLDAVVQAAVDSVRPTAEAREIRLDAALSEEPAEMIGDPDRLQQVLWNLLSNALRFTPRGGRVEVRTRRSGDQVTISVADSGIGIPPDFLPHVFDRFRQADGSRTRAYGGLGLGLAIVRHLVELHGGAVTAASPGEGRGATFTITLPLHAPVEIAPERAEQRPQQVEATRPLDGVRVLVVDDEAPTRELLELVLAQQGAGVVTACTAREALEKVEAQAPDVLVSDIGMPNEDGYALIQKVRALDDQRGGAVPAVALTAYARDEDRRRAISAGYQVHVAKPIEPNRLLSVVMHLAGRA